MLRTLLFLSAALALSACASEINKPIGLNDDWADRATALETPGMQ